MSFGAAQKRRRGAGNELVRACEQWLSYARIFHYRNNSGAMPAPTGTFIRFGTPGSPDIVAVIRGLYVGLECKSGSGRLSDSQKAFRESLIAAGGRYYEIRSLEDLSAAVKEVQEMLRDGVEDVIK